MFPLRCTVRNCKLPLQQNENALSCEAGHQFDRARQGYWPLVQPQDRKSIHAGDSDDAVLARHRWLQRGHAAGLIGALRQWIAPIGDPKKTTTTLDLGCGEGSFGPALFAGEAAGYCGIDLSKRAIKLAARGWTDATWVLANADRELPAADQSVDRVVSFFGRRPVSEIARVLVPGGICIVAVPGEEDLIELRQEVQQAGRRRSRWQTIVEEMSDVGLVVMEHRFWKQKLNLQPDEISDAMAMTYRGVRYSQNARMESLEAMSVTLAADLILLRKPA